MSRLRRLPEESGIIMVITMGTLLVLSLLAAAVLANSIFSATAGTKQRMGKVAYGDAITGLRTAIYRLNANPPATDSACLTLPDGSTPLPSSGLCGPYSSDSSVNSQPMPTGQRYDYWITPSITSGTCAGAPLNTTTLRQLSFVTRCVTARGQYTVNGTTITRRVQARVVSSRSIFPIPGIWGTTCIAIGNINNVPNGGGCANISSVNGATYIGSLGSNATAQQVDPTTGALTGTAEPIQIGLAHWNDNPFSGAANVNPANLYLGNQTPTTPRNSDPYLIKDGDGAAAAPAASTSCVQGNSPPTAGATTTQTSPGANGTFSTTYPCLPWTNNLPVSFGFYFPLPPADGLFTTPPAYHDSSKKPTAEIGCASTAVTLCNNNNIFLATNLSYSAETPNNVETQAHYSGGSGCGVGTSPYTAATFALNVPDNCTLTVPDGTYYFCKISLGNSSRLLPSDQASGAEVRIFLDSANTVRTSSLCTAATAGGFNTNGTNNSSPTWFTNAGANSCSAGTFASDPWTALAGQLYIDGGGDPLPNANQNFVRYPPKITNVITLPKGMVFQGLLQAPNNTLFLDTSACVRGGLAAGAVDVANNGNFQWDSAVDQVAAASNSGFYQVAFSDCPSTYATDPNSC